MHWEASGWDWMGGEWVCHDFDTGVIDEVVASAVARPCDFVVGEAESPSAGCFEFVPPDSLDGVAFESGGVFAHDGLREFAAEDVGCG